MRDMRDSGVEWIGEVPANWEITRIKNCFELRNERNYEALEDVNLISLYTDRGVVQHCDLTETTGNKAVTADGYKLVYERDIVVNIILCWMGAVGMSKYNGVTSPAYDVYKPIDDVVSEYYHYLFRTPQFNGECYRYGRGIMLMRWRTYSTEFGAINIPLPPRETQLKIVEHLDQKCGQIDALIANVQAQIEKLKAYKKSVITEVVTKGLDPSAPMKDSWVENQPCAPAHWNYVRGRYVTPVNKSVSMPDKDATITYAPMECVRNDSFTPRTIQVKNLSSGLSTFAEGDVLLAKITPCFENGNVAIANNLVNGVGVGSSELIAFSPKGINARFFMYYLQNVYFVESGKATIRGIGGLRRITSLFVDNISLYMPDEAEQQSIVDCLDVKCSQIDRLIAIKQTKIDKLNAYKKSLIYEYVTGKKEVP